MLKFRIPGRFPQHDLLSGCPHSQEKVPMRENGLLGRKQDKISQDTEEVRFELGRE